MHIKPPQSIIDGLEKVATDPAVDSAGHLIPPEVLVLPIQIDTGETIGHFHVGEAIDSALNSPKSARGMTTPIIHVDEMPFIKFDGDEAPKPAPELIEGMRSTLAEMAAIKNRTAASRALDDSLSDPEMANVYRTLFPNGPLPQSNVGDGSQVVDTINLDSLSMQVDADASSHESHVTLDSVMTIDDLINTANLKDRLKDLYPETLHVLDKQSMDIPSIDDLIVEDTFSQSDHRLMSSFDANEQAIMREAMMAAPKITGVWDAESNQFVPAPVTDNDPSTDLTLGERVQAAADAAGDVPEGDEMVIDDVQSILRPLLMQDVGTDPEERFRAFLQGLNFELTDQEKQDFVGRVVRNPDPQFLVPGYDATAGTDGKGNPFSLSPQLNTLIRDIQRMRKTHPVTMGRMVRLKQRKSKTRKKK
jgi:hypothetical protein